MNKQQSFFAETMTQLHTRIHRPRCEQFNAGFLSQANYTCWRYHHAEGSNRQEANVYSLAKEDILSAEYN